MPYILAFDTTHGNCSVAVLDRAGNVLCQMEDHSPDRQAELLLQLVEMALQQLNITYQQLDAIGVSTGPGSFTGIRIGLSAARGLGLVLKKPVIGITSFETVLYQDEYMRGSYNKDHNRVNAVILDARRGQIYVQLFDICNTPLDDPKIMEYAELSRYLKPYENGRIIGNSMDYIKVVVSETLPNWMLSPTPCLPAAPGLGKAVCEKMHHDQAKDFPPVPLYIREPDAKISQN